MSLVVLSCLVRFFTHITSHNLQASFLILSCPLNSKPGVPSLSNSSFAQAAGLLRSKENHPPFSNQVLDKSPELEHQLQSRCAPSFSSPPFLSLLRLGTNTCCCLVNPRAMEPFVQIATKPAETSVFPAPTPAARISRVVVPRPMSARRVTMMSMAAAPRDEPALATVMQNILTVPRTPPAPHPQLLRLHPRLLPMPPTRWLLTTVCSLQLPPPVSTSDCKQHRIQHGRHGPPQSLFARIQRRLVLQLTIWRLGKSIGHHELFSALISLRCMI